jgi:hypothetical protein
MLNQPHLGIEGRIFRDHDKVIDCVEAEADCVEFAITCKLEREVHVGTAGVSPAAALHTWISDSQELFALRAHCGRDARGPSLVVFNAPVR